MHKEDGQMQLILIYGPIRAANDSRNYSPTNEHDTCPMSRCCTTSCLPSIHFGCPTSVLKKGVTRWEESQEMDRQNKSWNKPGILINAFTEGFTDS
jgi:hypothetical protein